jgi:glycosyltransferase involved in cell wall biosynthesis
MMTDENMYEFNDVSLLITHYNRSSSLRRLLQSFQDQNCSFGEIIVSDDGSDTQSLNSLEESRKIFNFRLITTSKNKGLGNNINKGQDAVTRPFTLYVQEDFVPTSKFAGNFSNSLNIMKARQDIDLIRFYSYLKFPYLKEFENGFSEMYVKPWPLQLDYTKIYAYSDHPHLRRSNFLEKFGRYSEGIKGDKTEYNMCVSFIRNKGKGLFFNDYQTMFNQINSEDEPSTMKRSSWTQTRNPVITFIRNMYRQAKYNFDIYLS